MTAGSARKLMSSRLLIVPVMTGMRMMQPASPNIALSNVAANEFARLAALRQVTFSSARGLAAEVALDGIICARTVSC